MSDDNKDSVVPTGASATSSRRGYKAPRLERFGPVSYLTHGAGSKDADEGNLKGSLDVKDDEK